MQTAEAFQLPDDVEERTKALLEAREALNIQARADLALFCALVGKDENGNPVVMGDIQLAIARSAQTERLAVFVACPEIGKSVIGVILHCVWILGNNPMATIAVISGTKDRAKELVSAVKRYIENDPDVKAVFPDLAPGVQWSETKIRVAGCGNRATPSLAAFGMGSKGMLGQRLDKILLDDVDNEKTITSQVNRDTQFRYVSRTVLNRLMPGGQILVFCNAWHCDDVAHRLVQNSNWKLFRIPIRVSREVVDQWPTFEWKLGTSIWPAKWPEWRIKQRIEDTHGDDEIQRCYYCRPLRDGASFFKQTYFDVAKDLGEGCGLPSSLEELFLESDPEMDRDVLEQELDLYLGNGCAPSGWKREVHIFHGVDLATCVNNDKSAICSLAWYVNEDLIRPLYLEEGNWETTKGLDYDDEEDDSLIGRMRVLQRKFGGTFVVENVGTQLLAVNLIGKDVLKVNIVGFPTSAYNKKFIIREIAAEYSDGQVLVPSRNRVAVDPYADELHAQFSAFSPADHPGDLCAAAMFAFGMVHAMRTGKFLERGGQIQVDF